MSLDKLILRYGELQAEGVNVYVPIINSVVRHPKGGILRDVLLNEVARSRIDSKDIILTIETTGSPTDGLAIIKIAKVYPEAVVEIYPSVEEDVPYLKAMHEG